MKEDKILPVEAAAIMGASPQFVRIGMQTGKLDIGSAVKMSSIWTYNIQRDRLAEHVGRNIDKELETLRKERAPLHRCNGEQKEAGRKEADHETG